MTFLKLNWFIHKFEATPNDRRSNICILRPIYPHLQPLAWRHFNLHTCQYASLWGVLGLPQRKSSSAPFPSLKKTFWFIKEKCNYAEACSESCNRGITWLFTGWAVLPIVRYVQNKVAPSVTALDADVVNNIQLTQYCWGANQNEFGFKLSNEQNSMRIKS